MEAQRGLSGKIVFLVSRISPHVEDKPARSEQFCPARRPTGTLGLDAIKAEGRISFAQDESARYDLMPRSAIAAGCVDFVLSPENIAKELTRIAKYPTSRVTSKKPL